MPGLQSTINRFKVTCDYVPHIARLDSSSRLKDAETVHAARMRLWTPPPRPDPGGEIPTACRCNATCEKSSLAAARCTINRCRQRLKPARRTTAALKLEFYTRDGQFVVVRQPGLIGIPLLICVGNTESQVSHRNIHNGRLLCIYLVMARSQ